MTQIKINDKTQTAINLLAEFDELSNRITNAIDELLCIESLDNERVSVAMNGLDSAECSYRSEIVDAITLAIGFRLGHGQYQETGL